MDVETRLLIDRLLFILGMLMFVLGVLGELLGWWNEFGVLVSLSGLMVGLYSAMDRTGTLLLEGQQATHQALLGIGDNQQGVLENQESMLGNQDGMLANQEAMIDRLDRIVDLLDERLPPA